MKVLGWLILLGFIVFMIASLVATFVDAASQVPGATAYVALICATLLGALVTWIAFKAARVPERRSTPWVKSVVGPNGRYLFGLFILAWMGFMLFLFLLPPEPSGVPNALIGGLAFVGLLAGTFIWLGFVWSIITE